MLMFSSVPLSFTCDLHTNHAAYCLFLSGYPESPLILHVQNQIDWFFCTDPLHLGNCTTVHPLFHLETWDLSQALFLIHLHLTGHKAMSFFFLAISGTPSFLSVPLFLPGSSLSESPTWST